MNEQTLQSTIYIGLNDADTGVQKFSTEKYLSILKNVCRNYQVAFSIHRINGGYFISTWTAATPRKTHSRSC